MDAQILFRVTLDRAPSEPVTVSYATADGTALAGEDYEATSGTLTFAAGETEQTVAVTVIDDAVEDSGETFRLVLSGPAGAQLADGEATGTILNTEQSVSEPSGGDLPADTTTTGVVMVGGTAVDARHVGSAVCSRQSMLQRRGYGYGYCTIPADGSEQHFTGSCKLLRARARLLTMRDGLEILRSRRRRCRYEAALSTRLL